MPGKHLFVSPFPSVLPDLKPIDIDLTQYFIFKQCYDLYVTVSNLYQAVSDYFINSQESSEKSREFEALGSLVNKKPNSLPLSLSDNRIIQLRDDNGLVVTTIKFTPQGDCYNLTTKAPCTPAEFVSVRYKPIINSPLEDSEAAGLPADKTAVKSVKTDPLVSGVDPGWIDRELSRRENARPPHVIWERYLAKREKKTGSMRKFTAMTAGMYNVWPGSYLSYHHVSKGLFETAYF